MRAVAPNSLRRLVRKTADTGSTLDLISYTSPAVRIHRGAAPCASAALSPPAASVAMQQGGLRCRLQWPKSS